jgi:pSer/pThr/pTyr-binding forkhead associated (FHA) protein
MCGGNEAYAPGVHYFATRLFDLDFASIGKITSEQGGPGVSGVSPDVEELIDYPRNTGRIRYLKLLVSGGRLTGALMLGEREQRVRLRGRAFKRLIDEQIDVSSIRGQLLDPAFDLNGWLQTQALTRKPDAAPASAVAAQGKIKGTRAINLADLPASMLPQGVPSKAPPTSPSEGVEPKRPLHVTMASAQMPPPIAPIAPIAAYLEGQGRRWELGAAVITVGRDPEAQIVLTDPLVSHVHAQISRHGNELYVRDLGSNAGTWVNGAPVIVPHRLKGGDRIRFGSIELVARIDYRADLAAAGGGAMSTVAPFTDAPATRRPHLEVRAGACLGLTFGLAQSPAVIGRDPALALRLDDKSVSWRHAQLREVQGGWALADLQSEAGTSRNGQRLAPGQEVLLQEGDLVQLGEAMLVYTSNPIRHAQLRAPQSMTGAPQ